MRYDYEKTTVKHEDEKWIGTAMIMSRVKNGCACADAPPGLLVKVGAVGLLRQHDTN